MRRIAPTDIALAHHCPRTTPLPELPARVTLRTLTAAAMSGDVRDEESLAIPTDAFFDALDGAPAQLSWS